MKNIRKPTREELERLEDIVEFNEEERLYWDEIKQRRKSQVDDNDFRGRIQFYQQELKLADSRFNGRIAIERRIKYLIGHSYECLATFGLGDSRTEGGDLKERSKAFELAVLWYQSADETVGFLTDYALRQAESCFGAANFRRQAELEIDVTKGFIERGKGLLSTIFGQEPLLVSGDKLPDYLMRFADKEVDSVVKAYLFRDKTEESKLN